jgi:hypothetical protein
MANDAPLAGSERCADNTPPAALSRWLVWGAAAAPVAGILSASAALIEAARGDEPGFTVTTALALLSLLPQIVVVVALVRMTEAIDPIGLNGSSRFIPVRCRGFSLLVSSWTCELPLLFESS